MGGISFSSHTDLKKESEVSFGGETNKKRVDYSSPKNISGISNVVNIPSVNSTPTQDVTVTAVPVQPISTTQDVNDTAVPKQDIATPTQNQMEELQVTSSSDASKITEIEKLQAQQDALNNSEPEVKDNRIEDAYNRKVSELEETNNEKGFIYTNLLGDKGKEISDRTTPIEKLKDLRTEIYYMAQDDSNIVRSKLTNAMLDKGFDLATISWTVLGTEVAPITGAIASIAEIPETAKLIREAASVGEWGAVALYSGLQLTDFAFGLVGLKVASKGAKKVLGERSISKVKNKDKIALIREQEAIVAAAARKAAKAVAQKNSALQQSLIEEFEENTGKIISTKVANKSGVRKGKITSTIDQGLARKAGDEINRELFDFQEARKTAWAESKKDPEKRRLAIRKFGDASDEAVYRDYVKENDIVANPILNEDKFDSLIAVAADLAEKKPEIFKRGLMSAEKGPDGKVLKGKDGKKVKGKKETFSDMIFRLAVNDEFGGDDALAESLVKYGLSYDDFMLAAVGSSTKAGKVLNRFSQASRAISPTVTSSAKDAAETGLRNPFVQGFLRFENIRRGSMTSMVKTAMRNAQSATIVAPAETIAKVFDNTLLAMGDTFRDKGIAGAIGTGINELTPLTKAGRANWSGSTRSIQRIFENPKLSRELTEYILDRPEFEKEFLRIRDNVNEYRKYAGRGEGGIADTVFSKMEDAVDILQIPNKIQEYMIRNGAFMGELERLVKREYKKELVDILEEGGIQDLLANGAKYRPKGARTFEDLVTDSTDHALEMTYASMPDNAILAEATRFITNNGLTVFIPFPRFMFKSLEMMAQYGGGALNPAIKRLTGSGITKPLTKNERKYISRNIVGAMGISAAAAYRSGAMTEDDVPADYKKMNAPDGTVIDTTAQFPLRQFLWMGEAARRMKDGTFSDWFNGKELTETFAGQSFRTGTGNIFIKELADIASGAEDPAGQSKAGKALGRIAGDYVTSAIVPLTQIVDIQRATGLRTSEYVDYAEDTTDQGFLEGVGTQVKRSLGSRGFMNLTDPSSDEDRPRRESIFSADRKRENIAMNLGLGISTVTRDDDYAEYIQGKGFTEFELSSKSRTPTIRNRENKLIRDQLPILVEAAKQIELLLRSDYHSLPAKVKNEYTQAQYVNTEIRDYIKTEMKSIRSSVRDLRTMGTEEAVILTERFGRLGKDKRKVAIARFYTNIGKPPRMSDPGDLETLIELSK